MRKKCFVCEKSKPIESFYRHQRMKDKHLNKCKECTKAQAKSYFLRNRDENLSKMRAYYHAHSKLKTRKNKTGEYRLHKEDPKGYKSVHKWINRIRGRPDSCEMCKRSGLLGREIHWSNKSGQYKREVDDWERLCAKCHKNKDLKKYLITPIY